MGKRNRFIDIVDKPDVDLDVLIRNGLTQLVDSKTIGDGLTLRLESHEVKYRRKNTYICDTKFYVLERSKVIEIGFTYYSDSKESVACLYDIQNLL